MKLLRQLELSDKEFKKLLIESYTETRHFDLVKLIKGSTLESVHGIDHKNNTVINFTKTAPVEDEVLSFLITASEDTIKKLVLSAVGKLGVENVKIRSLKSWGDITVTFWEEK